MVIVLGLGVLSITIGASSIGFGDLLAYLGNQNIDPSVKYILVDLRIPRTMALIAIGMSLGLSGVLLQTVLDNPLAEPYTLGISGGAALGAVIAIFLGLSSVGVPVGALAGCFIVTLIILNFSSSKLLMKSRTLILAGIMVSLFCGSVVTLLVSLLDPTKIQTAVYWMMGQVGTTRDIGWPVLFLIFLFFFAYFSVQEKNLDRMLLGDDIAASLGTNLKRVKRTVIISVCILTSVSVAIAGLIGFVGLVSPHLTYLLLGTRRHKLTLTLAPLIGACLFLISDILARLLSHDTELPSGSIMALIGAPLLVMLMLKRNRYATAE